MKFKFEKLHIWQKAMDLGENIFNISKDFPADENFNLKSQINRAADSVALNISEGSIGQSNPEQIRFSNYAIRSLAETITCLHKAKRRNYIQKSIFNSLYRDCFTLMNMLIGFKNSLK